MRVFPRTSPAEMNQTQSSFWSTSALMGLSLLSVLTFSALDYLSFHKIAEDPLLFLILVHAVKY